MKPLRGMLSEFSWEAWIDVYGRLAERGVLEPVYWSGIPSFRAQVAARFPDCVWHDSMDASRGDPPSGHTVQPPKWTSAMLRVWQQDGQDLLAMLQRADLEGAFGLSERLDYFAHQLALVDGLLDELQPDIVLFSAVPHVGYDFVLYRLCLARGIPTLILEWCLYGPHTFFMDTMEDGDRDFLAKYRTRLSQLAAKPVEVSEEGRAYLAKLRGDQRDAAATHWPDLNRQAFGDDVYTSNERDKRPPLRERVTAELKRTRMEAEITVGLLVDDLKRWRANEPALWESAFTVEKGIPYRNAVRGHFVRSRIWQKHRKWLRTAFDRQRELRELARPLPANTNLIFVALHQQPERSTSPQGGAFVDQLKMIQLLSAAAPPDWRIVVKEHMAQLNPEALGHMNRPSDFYQTIAKLPNASLVTPFLPPSLMIDRSAVTVTVSGTVGWEAVVRGKPVFTFGDTWYRGCEGVFRIRDFESCRDAFAVLVNGYRVDSVKVDAFVETIEKNQTLALPQPPLVPYCSLTPEENARRLAVALEDRLRRNHGFSKSQYVTSSQP
jgi:hypothetical protein